MDETPKKRRVVLCMGEFCNMDRRAAKLLPALQAAADAANARGTGVPLKVETARCLSMCGAGPNCVIYPQDRVFNHLNAERLQQMIEDEFNK